MISVEESRSNNAMEKWLLGISKIAPETILREAGEEGTAKLRIKTPRDSGITASSWRFKLSKTNRGSELSFTNNSKGGSTFNIIQGLRYGHGTGNGGYVQPNDFVSPIVEEVANGKINQFVKDVVK